MTQTSNQIAEAPRRRCCQQLDRQLDPDLFKALGDPTRLEILVRLAGCRRPASVSEIACCCPIDISVVSRHLKMLRDAGVVRAQRHGKEVRYAVEHRDLAGRLRDLADAIDACCPPGCC